MMVVVPSLTESEESHPPIVGGAITSLEAARTPNMCGGIDQPSGVVSRNGAKEDTPKQEGPSANEEEHDAEDNRGHKMKFGDPDMKVGDVALKGHIVLPQGVTNEDPAHSGPPFALAGRVRVAVRVGELMVHAVG